MSYSRLTPYGGRPDRPIWFVVAAMTVVLAALGIGSAWTYSSVVVAQRTVTITPVTTRIFSGTETNGSLRPDGSLTLTLDVRVQNPSSRTLHLQLIAFSAWVEDGPAEAGLNSTRRIADDLLLDANGSRYFYRIFGESTEVSVDPVPATGEVSYEFPFALSASLDPSRFGALRNITDYYASTTGSPASATWISWVRMDFLIDGVPAATSPTAAAYLREIGRIEREEGLNLAG